MHIPLQRCYPFAIPFIQSKNTAINAIASSGVLDCDWRIAASAVVFFHHR
jgi:hypothetical protein